MKTWRDTRDYLIVGFSLAMGTYEILVGGARPAVLTFLSGLLLSPIVMRVDAARREDKSDKSDDEASP
jgi:hypothetical protein